MGFKRISIRKYLKSISYCLKLTTKNVSYEKAYGKTCENPCVYVRSSTWHRRYVRSQVKSSVERVPVLSLSQL